MNSNTSKATDHFIFLQSVQLVTRCMELVNTVSDAVLELTLPGEENTSIRTNGMTVSLGRHIPATLAGLQIRIDEGKFVLPYGRDVLNSVITDTRFVDTQVKGCSKL